MPCLSRLEQGSSKSMQATSDKIANANFKRCFIPEEKYLISLFADDSNPSKEIISEVVKF